MQSIPVKEFLNVAGGDLVSGNHELVISNVSIDSRQMKSNSLFFALKGGQTDGHHFVSDAFDNGAIACVVQKDWKDLPVTIHPDRTIVSVTSPIETLQKLAAWHRSHLSSKLIAVTGSNGKTIVKDLLIQMLSVKFLTGGSPGSYNSQLGVPLSVLSLQNTLEMSVMEAGISAPNEMSRIEGILKPDFGILTNIGKAHIASFGSKQHIANEKLKLFKNIPQNGWILIPEESKSYLESTDPLQAPIHFFGTPSDTLPYIENHQFRECGVMLKLVFPKGEKQDVCIQTYALEILSDIEVAVNAAYLLGISTDDIIETLRSFQPSRTRMEIWKSPAGMTIINDSCSADPISVQAALKSLNHISGESGKKIFVFGGMEELGDLSKNEHLHIGEMAGKNSVDMMVLMGKKYLDATEAGYLAFHPKGTVIRCETVSELTSKLIGHLTSHDTVLFKGPRHSRIDRVAQHLTGVIAPDRLIVDLQAVIENISRFRKKVGPHPKILGMVKALAYGSDLLHLAKELQTIGLDFLGVSTPDEGVHLRRSGIMLPILVMVCTADEVSKVIENNLTPVLYSSNIAGFLSKAIKKRGQRIDVHIKLDTGMGRLGILPEEFQEAVRRITKAGCFNITGLMTHFACAEDPSMDSFTRTQIQKFNEASETLHRMGYPNLLRHAAATAGAVRFKESHFDMVRIGLGLFGIYPSDAVRKEIELELAVSLVSKIAEVRYLDKNHMVGYGGTFKVPYDRFKIGVIPIGYHDGIPLSLSNRGHVLVNGELSPVIGRVSMDSLMIDLNRIREARQGSDVLIYGSYLGHSRRPEKTAEEAGTIAYELLSRLGPRIQRIYMGR